MNANCFLFYFLIIKENNAFANSVTTEHVWKALVTCFSKNATSDTAVTDWGCRSLVILQNPTNFCRGSVAN